MHMMIVSCVCAVVLGLVVEVRKIRRAKAFFQQEATRYAQLERLERGENAYLLRLAQFHKETAENDLREIEVLRATLGSYHWPAEKTSLLRRIERRVRSYEKSMVEGRRCLASVQKKRGRIVELSGVRQAYDNAACSLWIPFAPRSFRFGSTMP